MNKKFTMYRKFLAPAIKRMAAMFSVIALINGIYWTIYHCLCTAEEGPGIYVLRDYIHAMGDPVLELDGTVTRIRFPELGVK